MKDRMQRQLFESESVSGILSHRDLTDRLEAIRKLCLTCNNCGVNIGAHALAGKILKIVEGT